jgi:outer membrane protein assembly factor BamB
MNPSADKKNSSTAKNGFSVKTKTTVRTFGLSHRERAPLVFVETSRGSRTDETFFLISGPSTRSQELYQAAIAEFKRGSDIRPPEEYMNFLRETALGIEGGQLEQRLSFAAAWVRAGTCHWLTGGSYLIAQISKEGHVLRLPGSAGKAVLGHMDKLVATERAHFDDVEESMRQRRDHGDLGTILHRLSQERKLGGALVLEHQVVRGGLVGKSARAGKSAVSGIETGVVLSGAARRLRPGLRLKPGWILGLVAIAAAVVFIVKWPLGGASREARVEEVSEPRETSPVALDPGSQRTVSGTVPVSFNVTISPVWTKKFRGAVTSSPRVAQGKVYFGCRDARVYCLDAETGKEIWQCNVGSGVGASPAVHEGRVYVGSYDGTFWCIDASSGKAVWRFKSGARIVSSASVASGNVIFGSYDRNLYCLSTDDGSVKWKLETGGLVWSSPLIENGRCYFGSADGTFYCVLIGSGEVKWKYPARSPIYASPDGDASFVCSGANSGAVFILDAQNGKELSRTETGREVRSTIVVEGGNAYLGADDGVVRCIRVSDGAAVWSLKTGGAIRSGSSLDDGLLFVTSYDGKLHVIDVVTGTEVGAFDARSQIYSSPAVAGNRVYFGTNDGDLLCLKVTRKDR